MVRAESEAEERRGRGPPEDDGRPKRFAYPPQLVVVDGGQPQVAAAKRALEELGIDDVAVCGLAKRLEEVWLPGEDDPVVLPRTSEGLYLLQRVRDEAHRFAIQYQRNKRGKRLKSGPAGRGARPRREPQAGPDQALRFGESAETGDNRPDLRGPGHRPQDGRDRGRALAQAVPAGPAVNTATGEIIEDETPAPAGASPNDGGPSNDTSSETGDHSRPR